ncbi:hypothetical protein ACTMU2_18945 [Cupriavidus basilensis]
MRAEVLAKLKAATCGRRARPADPAPCSAAGVRCHLEPDLAVMVAQMFAPAYPAPRLRHGEPAGVISAFPHGYSGRPVQRRLWR